MKNVMILLIFTFLFFPSAAGAQQEMGTIEGTVNDGEGQPVSGASVIASSPSLIGRSTSTYSDQDGFYRIAGLASGLYSVRVGLDGFQTTVQNDVRVLAGKTLTVRFTLQLSKIEETVEVSDTPPLIDVSTTAFSVTVPPEILNNLPKRNVQNLFALTPGVGDDLVAYGADGAKAINVMLDGITMGNPHGREAIPADYDYNWIDEFHVTGIGAPPEYGRFTGVAGNLLTRSGGNEFHGLFETFFHNQNLTSRNIPETGPKLPFKNLDFSGQAGGPIIHDQLWFFSGMQHLHNETHAPLHDIGTNISTKFITKLTYRWDEKNTLQGLINTNRGTSQSAAGPDVLPEATSRNKNVEAGWNVTWISLLNPSTHFEGRFGGFHNHLYDTEDQPDLPGHLDLGTGVRSVNSLGTSDERESRVQLNGSLSHYAADFLGQGHDFRFGVQFERSSGFLAEYLDRPNGGMIYLDYFDAPYLRYLTSGRNWDGTNQSTSAYAQDEWNLTDRLKISAGVRWDHNRGSTDKGIVFATDPVAPRMGAIWLLERRSQTVIKAHYGDYYEGLLNRFYSFLSNENSTIIVQLFDPDTAQWQEILRSQEAYVGDKKFKQPFVRQFTIGVDRVMPGEIPIGVHYIYRRFGNIVEDIGLADYQPHPFVNPLDGQILTIYNRVDPNVTFFVTNPLGLYRRYDGLEFVANKYLFKKLSVMGSFVYSRLNGNYPGDHTFPSSNTPFLDTPNSLINFPGRLADDPTIAWKIVGSYSLPYGFNTGWYFRHATGDTWTTTVYPGLPCCRSVRILAEPAGSRRLPSQNLLDMRIEKEFPFYSGQLLLTMDIFNVFNSAYALHVQNFYEAPNFGMPLAVTDPRIIRIGLRYTF